MKAEIVVFGIFSRLYVVLGELRLIDIVCRDPQRSLALRASE